MSDFQLYKQIRQSVTGSHYYVDETESDISSILNLESDESINSSLNDVISILREMGTLHCFWTSSNNGRTESVSMSMKKDRDGEEPWEQEAFNTSEDTSLNYSTNNVLTVLLPGTLQQLLKNNQHTIAFANEITLNSFEQTLEKLSGDARTNYIVGAAKSVGHVNTIDEIRSLLTQKTAHNATDEDATFETEIRMHTDSLVAYIRSCIDKK